MHDIEWIRENPDEFDAGLMRRGFPAMSTKLLMMDKKRREAIHTFETTRAQSNTVSKEIGFARNAKDEIRAAALLVEAAQLRAALPQLSRPRKTLPRK